jgi:hypothetical protein
MKDGDIFLERLKQAVKRRNAIAIIAIECKNYNPPWWYWLDYLKGNSN